MSEFHSHHIGHTKQKKRFLLIGGIFGIFILGAGIFFATQEYLYQAEIQKTPSEMTLSLPFSIQSGETVSSIAKRLKEEEMITSDSVFVRYAKRSGLGAEFQAGKFYLPQNLTIPQIAQKLVSAKVDEVRITLIEGSTNEEIDAKLAELNLITEGEFLDCVKNCNFSDYPFLPAEAELREGFFFPDTYLEIRDQFTVEKFSKRLLSTFDQKTKSIFGNAERNGWDILKMASIVEMESRRGEERPIVAGILWKRFDNDWMLGADATTRYITGKKTEALTVTDLQTENPWNTRAVKGLPPGAICNPSLSAIEAAANPQNSEYWYYLHAPNGQIHYAENETEHNRNKAQFL